MKTRYNNIDLNHRAVDACSKLRKMYGKVDSVKNRRRIAKLERRLGLV